MKKIDTTGWKRMDFINFYSKMWDVPVIPIDENKTPVLDRWTPYQTAMPTEEELDRWFNKQKAWGLTIICQHGLFSIDLDTEKVYQLLKQKGAFSEGTCIYKSAKGYHAIMRARGELYCMSEHSPQLIALDPLLDEFGINATNKLSIMPDTPQREWLELYDAPVEVDYEAWLEKYIGWSKRSAGKSERAGDFHIVCPLHPDSDRGGGSMVINIELNSAHCFGCEYHSNIPDFIRACWDAEVPVPEKVVKGWNTRVKTKREEQEHAAKRELTEQERVEAEELLKGKMPLHKVIGMCKKLGIVAERHFALFIYLLFTSRILVKPISATIKGDSSAGKSYVPTRVQAILPSEAIWNLTDITGASLFHTPQEKLDHRIVVIYEREGTERSDYTLRILQSEGKLILQTTIQDPATKRFTAETKEIEAHTGFLTTTTDSRLNAENETRQFSLHPDESLEQSHRILDYQARKAMGEIEEPSEAEIEVWRNAQRLLNPYQVVIPYALILADLFPKEPLRVRRDFERVLSLIEVSAILHQRQRQIDGDKLIAELADYLIARCAIEPFLAETIYGLPPKTRRLIDAAKGLEQETPRLKDIVDEKQGFTIQDLMASTGMTQKSVYNWIKPAIEVGAIITVEEARGRKAARLKVSDVPFEPTVLPRLEDIAEQYGKKGEVYNPFTGESWVV